MAKSEMTGS